MFMQNKTFFNVQLSLASRLWTLFAIKKNHWQRMQTSINAQIGQEDAKAVKDRPFSIMLVILIVFCLFRLFVRCVTFVLVLCYLCV